jgi:hypothetical protein
MLELLIRKENGHSPPHFVLYVIFLESRLFLCTSCVPIDQSWLRLDWNSFRPSFLPRFGRCCAWPPWKPALASLQKRGDRSGLLEYFVCQSADDSSVSCFCQWRFAGLSTLWGSSVRRYARVWGKVLHICWFHKRYCTLDQRILPLELNFSFWK